ncbi:PLP-dependent aminotransferase family protein [Nitrospirillum viridazoti]|uniref:GntR family transcriptional regulator n=1 Tax=Nitrospirillum viridazoti CBAmc TaxID=1441467 RepID=A0A248K1U2_9PROT|nr:PLP-dependent aminotransferase family protein [Nitrospirillum amazonense]ASG24957.1 GntR family transcriptional regulator [Nitrospirillum amazonense CBAmc]TWB29968.1 GntR family transcriptional regulator [Nitrospirillum amazonense]
MDTDLSIVLDRAAAMPLAAQIHGALRQAILGGRLAAGARLPSWRDLAAQLGVARGTVRVAYERLMDEQLVVGMGAAGTRVARWPVPDLPPGPPPAETLPMAAFFHDFEGTPLAFQMGVPAQDAFPYTQWSRVLARAARTAAQAPVGYPDPRGHPELRHAIAAYLAIARGIQCAPGQVLVTNGYAGALNLAVRALGLEGKAAWMEEPGFPLTRTALSLAGMRPVPVPVDGEGLDVAAGVAAARDAALAVVTPGQQAPLGMALSLARRIALLDWARHTGAWVLEDDYLSELQLAGRAAPALAAVDHAAGGDARVLHAGTFSKTISPALRLGFLVVPAALAGHFGDVAACLSPAPAAPMQRAVAAFLAEGHYLRHLRRMKRLYAARRATLLRALDGLLPVRATAGLSVVVSLPPGTNDIAIANQALAFGMAPVPLSPWYATDGNDQAGQLLGVTNLNGRHLAADCGRLAELVARFG